MILYYTLFLQFYYSFVFNVTALMLFFSEEYNCLISLSNTIIKSFIAEPACKQILISWIANNAFLYVQVL